MQGHRRATLQVGLMAPGAGGRSTFVRTRRAKSDPRHRYKKLYAIWYWQFYVEFANCTDLKRCRGRPSVKKEYLELTRLIERLHRRFLDLLRAELNRLGIRHKQCSSLAPCQHRRRADRESVTWWSAATTRAPTFRTTSRRRRRWDTWIRNARPRPSFRQYPV